MAALLLSPTLLVLGLVVGYPLLAAFRESLYRSGDELDADGFMVSGERFVGLGADLLGERRKKGGIGMMVRRIAPFLGIAVIVAYCLAPFYWMVVSSFRRSNDIFDSSALPSPWSLENYRAVFSGQNEFSRALLNSLVVAGVTTVCTVLLATLAGLCVGAADFPVQEPDTGRGVRWSTTSPSTPQKPLRPRDSDRQDRGEGRHQGLNPGRRHGAGLAVAPFPGGACDFAT